MDNRIVAEREQHAANGGDERRVIAAGKVRAADGAGEERVAHEQIPAGAARRTNLQANAARAMARRVMRPCVELTERNHLSRRVEHVDRRLRLDVEAEHPARLHGVVVQEQVVTVEIDGNVEGALRRADAGDVIDVCVREQDVPHCQPFARDERDELLHFVAGIDEDRLSRGFARDDEAVFHEWAGGTALDYHDPAMILAVLDDLMFSSKIKTAATQLGLPLAFARSSAAALAEMRKSAPSLVIFDLNNPRTDPLGTVAAMKADEALAAIPIVGFVSHVDTDTISAARQAGVEVLPRSAFTMQLADILKRA
jgi:CheY-like chemotaxis protein